MIPRAPAAPSPEAAELCPCPEPAERIPPSLSFRAERSGAEEPGRGTPSAPLSSEAAELCPCPERAERVERVGRGGRGLHRLRLAAWLLAVLVATPPTATADWPQFRGDAALTGVARGDLPLPLTPLWTFEAEQGFEGTAAIAGGTVYAASLDGRLYALDLATGRERWRFEAGVEIRSSPTVAEGTVYLGDEAGVFHALDAASGEPRWRFATDAGIVSSAAVAGDRVLFGSYDGMLYALERTGGALAWKVETDNYVHATPTLAGEHVYFAGCDGYLRKVRIADGREVGSVRLGSNVAGSAAARDGRLHVGTFDNEVAAVDLDRMEVLWRYSRPERAFPFYSSPAVAGGLVMIGGRDRLVHALDAATGAARWTHDAGSRVDASPVVAGGRVVVATQRGLLLALDAGSGEELWRYEAGAGFDASPAVAAGRLVIGATDGTLYAFGGVIE